MTDFDAVCARLRSKELCAVAASEGVVWGQIKGYPFWPVRLGCVLAKCVGVVGGTRHPDMASTTERPHHQMIPTLLVMQVV